MYSTTVYLYQQLVRVLLVDTSGGYFTARYDPVYAKQLTINKGVDNVLLEDGTSNVLLEDGSSLLLKE